MEKYLFSLAFLAMAILLPSTQSKPDDPGNIVSRYPFCAAAENKTLCRSLVNGATNWQDATASSIHQTLRLADGGKPMLKELEQALSTTISLSRMSKESIVYTCNEVYDFAIECLNGALDDLKYGFKARLETKLSSVTGPSSECTKAIQKFGIASPLSSFFSTLKQYSSNCLAVARAV